MPGLAAVQSTYQIEARSRQRFRISLSLEYQLARRQGALSGGGKTIDLSSAGVLFESQNRLPVGRRVNLFIDWPFTDGVGLVLFILGRTVRASGNTVAVTILKHQFRGLSAGIETHVDDVVPSPS